MLLALSTFPDDEPLNDILVPLICNPQFFELTEWRLDYLATGEQIELQLQLVKVFFNRIFSGCRIFSKLLLAY